MANVDVGDPKFDHIWVEGIQVYNDFEVSVSVKSPAKVQLIVHPINTHWSQITTYRQKSVYRLGNTSYAGVGDSENCVGLTKVVVDIYVLFIVNLPGHRPCAHIW